MRNFLSDYLKPLSVLERIFKRPHTVRVPYEKKEPSQRYRGIHTNDLEKCLGCGACAKVCTCQAIKMVPYEKAEIREGATNLRPQVDYGRCSFCGQCVDICPSGSLKLTRDYEINSPAKSDFVFVPGLDRQGGQTGWEADTETSILRFEREEMPEADVEERIKNFEPVIKGFSPAQAYVESSRCLGCGACVEGCPAHMRIPEYLSKIKNSDYEGAVGEFFRDNPLPGICGTICTHRCENDCVYSKRGKPIQIRYLKGFAAGKVDDYSRAVPPVMSSTGRKVAVRGAGPAGLALAYFLRKYGVEVKIYDEKEKPGGTMRYAIPRYRLPEGILEKDVNFILSRGIQVKHRIILERKISFSRLMKDFDAVFLGVGLRKGIKMNVPGEDAKGVFQAIDFLRDINAGRKIALGKRAVIIGGGNVAMDAARTVLRLGAESYILYRRRWVDMPAGEEEKGETVKEGVSIMTRALPVEILKNASGEVRGLKFVKTKVVEQAEGSRAKVEPLYENKFFFACDAVIEALGQKADYSVLCDEVKDNLKLDKTGKRIVVDENGMTSIDGLYAGGDCVNGRGDIISAIADAKRAAAGILKRFEIL